MKTRIDKDNRRKLDVDDILSLFSALDVAKVVLPSYVAADLQRLPTVTPGKVDVYGLAAAVKKLTEESQHGLIRQISCLTNLLGFHGSSYKLPRL